MSKYSVSERMSIVKAYYSSNNSPIAAQRKLATEYKLKTTGPSVITIKYVIEKFERTDFAFRCLQVVKSLIPSKWEGVYLGFYFICLINAAPGTGEVLCGLPGTGFDTSPPILVDSKPNRHVADYNLTSEREILMYGTNLLKESTPSDRKHFVPKAKRIFAALDSQQQQFRNGIVTFVIPYKSDPSKLLITLTRQVRKLDFETGQSEVLAELPAEPSTARFNDGKCDSNGRAWTGTLVPGENEKGHLYRIDPEYALTRVSDKFTLSNGLAWSLDNRTMYFIDSEARKIYYFDYNIRDGTASNKQILIDYSQRREFDSLGVPDGMTIDIEGKLWVAHFGGACVLRIDPETRSVLRKIDMPCTNVTSCCFGGPHFDILYVTTAQKAGVTDQPQAGAVFAITGLGTRGQPPNNFVE
ncbi:Regucalcin [Araneus ventricosus]|uniref:Regucalcin n=1 Tax=Araneus ventricosus TaxID=182803 RepID=A0A4Y2LHX4_ARAVE|nr:Regucalcin [Araneus ventricosus]